MRLGYAGSMVALTRTDRRLRAALPSACACTCDRVHVVMGGPPQHRVTMHQEKSGSRRPPVTRRGPAEGDLNYLNYDRVFVGRGGLDEPDVV